MASNLGPEDKPLEGVPEMDRQRLTFGVEFEFALACLYEGTLDPDPEDGRVVYDVAKLTTKYGKKLIDKAAVLHHIAQTITDAGISCKSMFDDEDEEIEDLTVWWTDSDMSIIKPENSPKAYQWYEIEIKTPAYYFGSEAIDTIKRVCEILSNTYRIACTESCGIHVHVGNGYDGHSLETLQNLFATLWTFEPQISQIHPEHRTKDNMFCQNLRDFTYLAQNDIADDLPFVRTGIELLLHESPTIDNLMRRIACRGIAGAYDQKSWWTRKTIEFRQHKSTLDPAYSSNWAHLCVGLVEFADTVDRDTLEKFLLRHADDKPGEFSIADIVTALGMPYLAKHFTKVVALERNNHESGRTRKEQLEQEVR